jgi:hypothetical protein
MLRVLPAGLRPGMVTVRTCHLVPSGTVIGLFSGHMFTGPELRGDHFVAMSPIPIRGGPLRLGVDAAASLARFPSATQAGLYHHDCEYGTLVAEWRTIAHDPPLAVLVALADGRLQERIQLRWNFNLHCVEGTYTMGGDDSDGQDWCAAGGAVCECSCNAPYNCPLGRFLRTNDH